MSVGTDSTLYVQECCREGAKYLIRALLKKKGPGCLFSHNQSMAMYVWVYIVNQLVSVCVRGYEVVPRSVWQSPWGKWSYCDLLVYCHRALRPKMATLGACAV